MSLRPVNENIDKHLQSSFTQRFWQELFRYKEISAKGKEDLVKAYSIL